MASVLESGSQEHAQVVTDMHEAAVGMREDKH